MGVLGDIKNRLQRAKQEEETFKSDINNRNPDQALNDSEKVLEELETLDEEFVNLLLADDAQKAVESAREIARWEEDVAEFLKKISEHVNQVEGAINRDDHSTFRQRVNQIRNDVRKLKEDKEKLDLDQQTEKAIMLLVDEEEIRKELEWFEKAVKTLESEEKALENTVDSQRLRLDEEQLRNIEETIPRLESQIHRLDEAVKLHDSVQLKSSDVKLDIDFQSLKAFKSSTQREKAELEYLLSMIEELKEISQVFKNSSSRREYLKNLVRLSLSLGGLAMVVDSISSGDIPRKIPRGGSSMEQWKKNEISLEGLELVYVVEGRDGDAQLFLESKNVSEEILSVELMAGIPIAWRAESKDMERRGGTKQTNRFFRKFHLTPGKSKKFKLDLSQKIDNPTTSVNLEIAWGAENSQRSEELTINLK